MRIALWLPFLLTATLLATLAPAQGPAFAVASIRPSAAEVKFERDGATDTTPGTLHMRDVTLVYCIEWAYKVQEKQVSGPELLRSPRYDIQAKADGPATEDEMRLMMRQLLADRFKFSFHRESRLMKANTLTQLPAGHKMHESAPGAVPHRENTAYSTIAKAMTMQEFADFLAGPMELPRVDHTGLKGRYDFVLDFRPYLPVGGPQSLDDFLGAMQAALEGELGLKLERVNKLPVEVLVVDRLEKPSDN
jgi:uncharacterized protein (TIGR03435 family)